MTNVIPTELTNIVSINYNSIDAAIAEYDPSKTNYVLGDYVKVTADKKKYKLAAQTIEAGVIPKDNPTTWKDSTLSEFAMFNPDTSLKSEGVNGIKFSISGAGVDTIFFQETDGTQVIVREKDSNGVDLHTHTVDIYEYDIDSFGKYLFPKPLEKKRKIQVDLKEIITYTIEIEIKGIASCRHFVAGQKEDFGYTLADGMSYHLGNYFTLERDSWGDIISNETRLIEDATIEVIVDNSLINTYVNRLYSLQGKSILLIADDREKKEFQFTNIFGRLLDTDITPSSMISTKTLQIEGE